jgi:mRNA-degrading endonuclease YafQ of YafQ-DinJ toxin-antitoxin module
MKITAVYYSSTFKKHAKKHPHLKTKIIKRIEMFQSDPFNPSLKTHKLTGKLKGYYAFSVDYQTRIMFEFLDKDSVAMIDVGTHGIYG